MEKLLNFDFKESEKPEIKEFEGIKYKKVTSGYTLRQYFSKETQEKGPGPGWDTRWRILEKYGVEDPRDLPDEPYFDWVPMEK